MKSIFSRQATLFMLPLLLLMAGAVLFSGCESDPVAPHDETPALTEEDVAYQAGYLGMMFKGVGVQLVSDPSSNKDVYTHNFSSGGVTGSVKMDFRQGGENGTPATNLTGDFALLYTPEDVPLVLALGYGGSATFAFNIRANIVQATRTATILDGSTGTFVSGDYPAEFSFNNVVVTNGASYPASGTITFTTSEFEITLTYDGDNTAVLSLGGVASYTVNLDTGTLTPLD